MTTCSTNRAECVVDTVRDSIRQPEFVSGYRAGLAALVVVIVLGLLWKGVFRAAKPLPVAGLAAAAACLYALRDSVEVPDRVVLAVLLLAAAGLVIDVFRLPSMLALVAGAPGAVVLARASEPGDARWVELLVCVATLAGGTCVASFDRRWARHGLGAPLVALWGFGAYTTLPDTEGALAMLGALSVVALAAWPLRIASLGASGALALVGLVAWNAAFGGFGRSSSVVGAVACAGVLVIEPLTRLVLWSKHGPIDVIASPSVTRWWTLPAVTPVHLVLVFIAARVAGLEASLRRAVVIIAVAGVSALAVSILLSARTRGSGRAARTAPR